MLTLNSALEEAINTDGVQWVYIVTVEASATVTLSFVSGDKPLFGYPASVAAVGPLDSKLNMVTRDSSIGSKKITWMADGAFADMCRVYRIKGRKVTVKLGTSTMAESDFLTIGVATVEDWTRDGSRVLMETADARKISVRHLVLASRNLINKHPLRVIKKTLEDAGVSTDLYDVGSLNPDLYLDKTHYSTTRTRTVFENELGHTGIGEKGIPGDDVISAMVAIMDGRFSPGDDGRYKFAPYDPDDAIVATFAEPDTAFTFPSTTKNLFNDWTVKHLLAQGSDRHRDGPLIRYSREDSASITDHGTFEGKTESDWLNGFATLVNVIDSADGEGSKFILKYAGITGVCGARFDDEASGYSQEINAALSDPTRLAYLRLTAAATTELISIKEIVVYPLNLNPLEPAEAASGYPLYVECTIKARDLLSENAPDPTWGLEPLSGALPVFVFDETIPRALAASKLRRFSRGAPIVTADSDMRHLAVEVGDLVAINSTKYLDFGRDGSSLTDKFEIIGKRVNPKGSPPGIRFALGRAEAVAPSSTVDTTGPPPDVLLPANPQFVLGKVGSVIHDIYDASGDKVQANG